jgi:predicted glycosyltransferase involved in capsule biosynthesis
MINVSVIVIVKNRPRHLRNLLWGLNSTRSEHDFETIIIHMNEPIQTKPLWFKKKYIAKTLQTKSLLPLAKARNCGASLAQGDLLIFLDVDCIPDPQLVDDYIKLYQRHKTALMMGEVYYLPKTFPDNWSTSDLKQYGQPHKARIYLSTKSYQSTNKYELFWSLNFAVDAHIYWYKINGFNETYQGYGGEDTDFAFKARKTNTTLLWIKNACVYHQYHAIYTPPYQHFIDIINNATAFKGIWDVWPMSKWLQEFVDNHFIEWHKSAEFIKVIKYPTKEAINAAKIID